MNKFPVNRLFRVSFVFLLFLIIGGLPILFTTLSFTQVAEAAPEQLPTVQFENTTATVAENAGTVSLRVRLDAVYTTTVTLSYRTLDGSATAGSDYQGVTNGPISIPAGTLSTTIQIIIINNTVSEPTEVFYVQLFNPTNAVLGNNVVATITITDDDPTPTPAPTSGTPVTFADSYEPNNTLNTATTLAAGAPRTCSLTLWPAGDEDYFKFVGKQGSAYSVATIIQTAGLDTELFAYNTQGDLIGQNDDVVQGNLSSLVYITANVDGFYYVRVINRDPSNPAGKTYCIEIKEIDPPTPTPSQTPAPGADVCEFNSTTEYACVLEIGADKGFKDMSFVPVLGSLQDTDYYKVWMRQGTYYTCETFVNDYADTNMIFLNQNGGDFQPNLGNNDKEPGDYGSRLSLLAPYTGWLYILVGPIVAPPYEESYLHKYDIHCLAEISTPTPTPSATPTFAASGPPSGGVVPTAVPTVTPFTFPTFPATPTPFDFSILTPSPSATPPVINVQPLPTATPFGGGQQTVSINVTLYYDSNFNYLPELNEGIRDVAVALYDNASGNLIAFGSTNEAGMVSFTSITAAGAVRVVVPFLNYSQVVLGGSSNILVCVAPQPLPIGIP